MNKFFAGLPALALLLVAPVSCEKEPRDPWQPPIVQCVQAPCPG